MLFLVFSCDNERLPLVAAVLCHPVCLSFVSSLAAGGGDDEFLILFSDEGGSLNRIAGGGCDLRYPRRI